MWASMPNVMAAQPNIGGALCESSVIPFLVPRRKLLPTPTAPLPCSNAANIHRESKKGATLTMAITLSILDRFAKFFHY